MKKNLLILAILLFGYIASAQNTSALLADYINVKNALVSGDSKAAAQAGGILYQGIKGETSFAQKEALLKATESMSKASSIEKQRAAFSEVSTILWQVVKNSNQIEKPVYYQYCPMKKVYWLSREKEIKNPYYGSSMLTCGKVSEIKE